MFYKVYNIYLPAEDLDFCEQNQRAYEYACSFLMNMTAEIAKFRAVQEKMLGQGYVTIYASGFSQMETLAQLYSAHSIFAHRIVHYFARKYGVSLYASAVLKQFAPSVPEKPYVLTQEETEKTLAAYQTAQKEYEERFEMLRLSYMDILNCLFAQTDGQH